MRKALVLLSLAPLLFCFFFSVFVKWLFLCFSPQGVLVLWEGRQEGLVTLQSVLEAGQ